MRSRLKSVASGLMNRRLTLILSRSHHERQVAERKCMCAGSSRWGTFRHGCSAAYQARRVSLLEQVSQSNELVLVQLNLLVHLVELGVFDSSF